jgi:predicted Fe-Mo cluster-binding NifX family protein
MKRIAFSSDNEKGMDAIISSHFGRCPYFTLVDVNDDQRKVTNVSVVENPHFTNHVMGAVPDFIKQQKADIMVSGGMGRRAVALFEKAGIEIVTGFTQTVRQALEKYFNGRLKGFAPCSGGHHHEHHGEESCQ